jgi:D-alanine-D-alanine ligase
MRIAIVYSLPTNRAFHELSLVTDEDTMQSAQKVQQALESRGYEAFLVPISETTITDIDAIRANVIFDLLEWDGLDLLLSIQAMERLERLGIPMTGSGSVHFFETTDKVSMKKLLDRFHFATPTWQVCTTGEEKIRNDFTYPLIIKLACSHCSVGLSQDTIVHSKGEFGSKVKKQLKAFNQPVIVEEFIDGTELQVTLLERPTGLVMLPVSEITFTTKGTHAFLTFDSRWTKGHPDYKMSDTRLAVLDATLNKQLESVCLDVFQTCNFCDYARFDIRIAKDGTIYFLEVNSNPGLDDSPDYGMTISCNAVGLSFPDFIDEILKSSIRRFKKRA